MSEDNFVIVKELSSGTIYKRTDGLLILRQAPGKDFVTVLEIEEQLKVFYDIQKGELSPLLVVVDKLTKLDNEEKMLMRSCISTIANRTAVVTNNSMAIFIFNVILFLYRPTIPTKIFNAEKEALAWLKSE